MRVSIFLCSIYVLCYQSFLHTNLVSGGVLSSYFPCFLAIFIYSIVNYLFVSFVCFFYGDRNVFSIFYRSFKKHFRDINPDLQSKLSPLFHSLNFASGHVYHFKESRLSSFCDKFLPGMLYFKKFFFSLKITKTSIF